MGKRKIDFGLGEGVEVAIESSEDHLGLRENGCRWTPQGQSGRNFHRVETGDLSNFYWTNLSKNIILRYNDLLWREVLFEFHLNYLNTSSIGIPTKSLL